MEDIVQDQSGSKPMAASKENEMIELSQKEEPSPPAELSDSPSADEQ